MPYKLFEPLGLRVDMGWVVVCFYYLQHKHIHIRSVIQVKAALAADVVYHRELDVDIRVYFSTVCRCIA